MRPLRLEVEGFTCYRDRQPILDFSELTLFAISGPTGAGKSSLLDAMLYALFGEVPRIGKQGVSEFISQGRDRMSVTLDFRVRGREYRVTRASKQLKAAVKTDAALAELTTNGERSMGSQVKQVNDEIVQLLGLGYDEFIQTVVLPQGEFAKFLRAKPADQRSILQMLLRHEVFTRMRDAAEERRRALEGDLKGFDGKLSALENATDEALRDGETALASAKARQLEAATQREAADLRVQEARRNRAITEEVERLRTQRTSLQEDATTIETTRSALERARLAASVVPRADAAKAAAEVANRLAKTVGTAQAEAERALAAQSAAQEKATRAADAAKACVDLAARLRALDEISGEVGRLRTLATELEAADVHVSSAESALSAARTREAITQKNVLTHMSRLQALKEGLDQSQVDVALLEALDEALENTAAAKESSRQIASLQLELARQDQQRLDAERLIQLAQASYDRAQVESDRAQAALNSARASLDAAREQDHALAIRVHLHTGEPCPVCLQTVTQLPAAESAPTLGTLEEALKSADTRATRVANIARKAHESLANAVAGHEQVTATTAATAVRLARHTEALNDLHSSLMTLVPGGEDVDPNDIVSWIEERRAGLRAAGMERARVDADVRRAESLLNAARLAASEAAGEAVREADRRQRHLDEQLRLRTEVAEVTGRIRAVSTAPDPHAERAAVASRKETLEATNRQAAEELVGANQRAVKARADADAARVALADAQSALAACESALFQVVSEAGFANVDTALGCVRTVAEQERMLSRISDFDHRLALATQRLAELEPEITGKEITVEFLAAAESHAKSTNEAARDADRAVATIESDVARLRQDVAARVSLLTQRDGLARTFDVTSELATDLRGDRFQEYLLEEAFATLVNGASVRLKSISNRYTLQWESGEFYVVDHDNAGERRRAETLSGGETFMASLCLALQLSDEVLRTSGALQMDSLFIDEGFGTLDSDSLLDVTDAMEALRQEGDRMIGVISHRSELTDRLPGCVRVIKGIGESSWVLERVG